MVAGGLCRLSTPMTALRSYGYPANEGPRGSLGSG